VGDESTLAFNDIRKSIQGFQKRPPMTHPGRVYIGRDCTEREGRATEKHRQMFRKKEPHGKRH